MGPETASPWLPLGEVGKTAPVLRLPQPSILFKQVVSGFLWTHAGSRRIALMPCTGATYCSLYAGL